jgi:mRNA-degrading endonuclease RelE of RelBE toxin-antitoxin system
MNRVIVYPQVATFVRGLAPEPRKRLVLAMKALPNGDTLPLEGSLAGYFRLRVGGYRVIYADGIKKGVRTFDCVFAERRPIVYELFQQIVAEQMMD